MKFFYQLTNLTFKFLLVHTFKKAAAVQEPPYGTGLILFRSAVGDSEIYI